MSLDALEQKRELRERERTGKLNGRPVTAYPGGASSEVVGTEAGILNPAGAIMMYGGSGAPSGWLLCDGSAVSRTTYADLFAVVSTAYGPGDGSTSFNLPDFGDRYPLGDGYNSALGDDDGLADDGSREPIGHGHGAGTLAPASDGAHAHGNAFYTDDADAQVEDHGGQATSADSAGVTDGSSAADTGGQSGITTSASTYAYGSDDDALDDGGCDFEHSHSMAHTHTHSAGHSHTSPLLSHSTQGHSHGVEGNTESAGAHTHGITGAPADSTNWPPHQVVNFIIKT